MRTTTIWNALSKVQHQIAEILPVHGGRFDARLRQEAFFAEILQKRMDERDNWRIPAANWQELERIGREMGQWADTRTIYERKAADSQKELSRVSRQWQAMMDLARGRTPPATKIAPGTTVILPFGSETRTSA